MALTVWKEAEIHLSRRNLKCYQLVLLDWSILSKRDCQKEEAAVQNFYNVSEGIGVKLYVIH